MSIAILKRIMDPSSAERILLRVCGEELSASQLDAWSSEIANRLLQSGSLQSGSLQSGSLREKPLGILAPPSLGFVASLIGIWKVGGIAVPLQPAHPVAELEYLISDTGLSEVLVHESCLALSSALASRAKFHETPIVGWRYLEFSNSNKPANSHHQISKWTFPNPEDGALIIYTSGTTNRPKGVVSTFKSLDAQIHSLQEAWEWSVNDQVLNVLPLHHVHGLVNILCCSLATGAHCELAEKFDAAAVWDKIASGEVNVFMAVPTIYIKLIEHFRNQNAQTQNEWSSKARHLRLMVSGSSALPAPVFSTWEGFTGHRLLERYGMTETGMILSNPYSGDRKPGFVGLPLPGVEVRLANEGSEQIEESEVPGEIQVKGPGVFREYWKKPRETQESFSSDGWFRTGDIAERDLQGYFRILGRNSQDIIKSGGYKISALEIESCILESPHILEVAVVGIPDATWGERVAAVCVLASPKTPASSAASSFSGTFDPVAVIDFLKTRIAHYKIPTVWMQVTELPRNSMGKTVKKTVKDKLQAFAQKSIQSQKHSQE